MPAAKPIAHQTTKPPGFGGADNVSESITDEASRRGSRNAEPKVSVKDKERLSQQKKPAHTYVGNSAAVFTGADYAQALFLTQEQIPSRSLAHIRVPHGWP